MIEKTELIINKLDSFAKQPISEELLLVIMKAQSLVKEINTDGD